jgi:FkbM family methyltransferase
MSGLFNKGLGGGRHLIWRRIVLPVVRTTPARRAALALARHRYEACGRVGRIIDKVLIAATPNVEERAESVRVLVELFFDLCSAAEVDVFVEAGAKEASASERSAESGVSQVVAFEANPYTHQRFAPAATKAGVDYRHVALSERAGDVTFLVRRNDDGSPIPDGQGSLLIRPDHHPGYEEVTVRAATLDDEIKCEGRVAMWVDVEGAVAEVFGGATRLLERTDVVIVEVEAVETWTGQRWLAGDVVSELASRGLRAVARDMQSRWQCNVLFVRDALVSEVVIDDLLAAWRRTPSAPGSGVESSN